VCFLPFMFLFACRQTTTQDGNGPIASEFKIVAHYYPGYSKWEPWEYTITRDGTVVNSCDTRATEPTLSEIDVRDLVTKINEADFFGLREKFSASVTDNPTLVLTITQNKRTHKVSVYAPGHLIGDKEVNRFLLIWSEILRRVPSPNPDQKPELYEPQLSAAERFRYPTWTKGRNTKSVNPSDSDHPSSDQKAR
jgi:hypothetical protein